ncbi:MAG: M48 family metallopeptidase [Rhodobacteraceae bacterium]|nr:M48 family metallopeptidase [Paracoccaceae bacterium]
MGQTHVLDGDPPVIVTLRRSGRTRRFLLRVSCADGRVSLSLPVWAAEAEALAFLEKREPWLRRQLANVAAPCYPRIGGTLPIAGVLCPIRPGTCRVARFLDGVIEVPDTPQLAPRIGALLQSLAREQLTTASDHYAQKLGRQPRRITLRDPRTRWGSCSARGDLMYSWRLVMAPPEVLNYVVAHEVAHLAEMNHSPRFWTVCGQLFPRQHAPRAWLKSHGAELLAWRFDSTPDAVQAITDKTP